MKQLRMTFPAAVFTMAMISHASLQAGVLVLESFNYGAVAVNGVAAIGTGLTGSWTATNTVLGSGSASSVFSGTGLTFGANYATSNGALITSSTYNGNNSFTTATVQLSPSAATIGTLWSSYLINWGGIGLAGNGSTLTGIGGSAAPADNTNIFLRSQMASNTLASDRKIGSGYDATATISGNTALAIGTTYLYVSKYTNVGTPLSAGTTGVATTWILTVDQYNALYTSGSLTEAGLNGVGAVTQKISDPAITTGNYAFDGTRYLTLKADAPDSNGLQTNATWDEIKYGTDIGDVIGVVPEPSAVSLIGLALGSLGLRRRERA